MSKESSHRVVVIVDEGSNPFELGVATELFGLRRPELERDWYDLVLCTPEPAIAMHSGFFTLTGVRGLDQVDGADTVIVPNRPDPEVPPSPAIAVRRTPGCRARGEAGQFLHRRFHPGRRRSTRRAEGNHALALGRAVQRDVPRRIAGT